MFAARLRDENAINEQQAAAAAKPLNQGIKGLAPKTPGNPKTPFKSTRNDENANQTLGKGGAKGGKPERNAFVTPASRHILHNVVTMFRSANSIQTQRLPVPHSATKPLTPKLSKPLCSMSLAMLPPALNPQARGCDDPKSESTRPSSRRRMFSPRILRSARSSICHLAECHSMMTRTTS